MFMGRGRSAGSSLEPRGEAAPLDRVATLARLWYGRHADPSPP
jgi:hypothetical protein